MPDALGDPDKDGLTNLLEFALGLDPQVASMIGTPQVFLGNATGSPAAANETGYLTMIVTRNAAASALEFHSQVSNDLTTWLDGTGDVSVLEQSATRLKVRDNTPVLNSAHRDIRLKVVALMKSPPNFLVSR